MTKNKQIGLLKIKELTEKKISYIFILFILFIPQFSQNHI